MKPLAVHLPSHRQRGPAAVRARQSGVVLIVVLIMLVVIGLVSAAAMRGALTADQISNNTRLENLAKQAAQIALRYCEEQVSKVPSGIPIKATSTWEAYGNWVDTIATRVPEAYMKSTDTTAPKTLPQCMAELSAVSPPLPGGQVYVITARGFGPDYDAATNSGAVVWLQSTITY